MGLCLLFAQTTAATENLSVLDPASPPAEWIRYLAIFVLAVTGLIFAVVEGVLIYSLIRFRGKPADGTEPPQVYGSLPIEIAWTVGPGLIVFLLVLVVIRTEFEVRTVPAEPPTGSEPLNITVIGHQWWWEYRYEKFGAQELTDVVTANEMHIPLSDDEKPRPVILKLESVDVCHSWWVPRLMGKTDLLPGRVNTMWFQTAKEELFLGQCAEYCGTQHAGMLLRVDAEPVGKFRDWLANEAKPEAEEAKAMAGRKIFLSEACVNCHRIRGTPADAIFGKEKKPGTRFGPDLTHLASRRTIASGTVLNTPENLRKWIKDPQTLKPGCWMPAMSLTDDEIKLVAEYLGKLR